MIRRIVAVLALALVTARCADQPTTPVELSASGLQASASGSTRHFVRWSGSSAPQFRERGSSVGTAQVVGASLALGGPLNLERYSVSFWAVRGKTRSAVINYKTTSHGWNNQFLSLTITDPTRLPNGRSLGYGDSVKITVTIDTTNIGVSLAPTGLTFGRPAQLVISYQGADGDLNGDGVVDWKDRDVETHDLGMWWREGDASNWQQISATQNVNDESFTVALPHFSQYAVSW